MSEGGVVRYTRFAPGAARARGHARAPVGAGDEAKAEAEALPPAAAGAGAGRRSPAGAAAEGLRAAAPSLFAVALVVSFLVPMMIPVGSLLLMPYRIVLLLVFVPLTFGLLSGRAGPLTAADGLIAAAAVWASLSLLANHATGAVVETIGIFWLEVWGAYLVGRVGIRSAADFRRLVRAVFAVVMALLPFAVVEAVTHRPVLLEMIPNAIEANGNAPRLGLRRAQTVFDHPILYGAFAASVFGLAWYVLTPQAGVLVRAARGAVISAAVFFSLSAGAFLSVVVQSVFIGWEMATGHIRRRWRLFFLLAAGGYLAFDVLIADKTPFHTLVHYATFNTNAAYTRIHVFNYGMENVAANPLLGLGLNDWERPRWLTWSVDNFWLLLAMRHGVPMLLLFVAGLWLSMRAVARAGLTDPLDRACRKGWLTVLGALVVVGGTVHYWETSLCFFMLLVGAGAWMATGGARPQAAAPAPADGAEPRPRGRPPRAPTARRRRA